MKWLRSRRWVQTTHIWLTISIHVRDGRLPFFSFEYFNKFKTKSPNHWKRKCMLISSHFWLLGVKTFWAACREGESWKKKMAAGFEVIHEKSDTSGSQLSISQPVHVLNIQRQLVMDRLISSLLVSTLCLQGKDLDNMGWDKQQEFFKHGRRDQYYFIL